MHHFPKYTKLTTNRNIICGIPLTITWILFHLLGQKIEVKQINWCWFRSHSVCTYHLLRSLFLRLCLCIFGRDHCNDVVFILSSIQPFLQNLKRAYSLNWKQNRYEAKTRSVVRHNVVSPLIEKTFSIKSS